MGDLGHHAEVVRDEHHAHALFLLDPGDQGEDLRLGGDIQGGGRLIGDQQGRLERQGHGDHHALALAAGQAEWVHVAQDGRVGQADERQQLEHAALALRTGVGVVHAHDFADLLAHGHQRIEGRQRLLEDHGHVLAAHRQQGGLVLPQQVLAAEQDLAALRLEVVGQQAHDGVGAHRLARAGLADDAQDLPDADVVGHIAHGVFAVASRGSAMVRSRTESRVSWSFMVIPYSPRLRS